MVPGAFPGTEGEFGPVGGATGETSALRGETRALRVGIPGGVTPGAGDGGIPFAGTSKVCGPDAGLGRGFAMVVGAGRDGVVSTSA